MLELAQDDALDAGPRKIAPGTERLCAATGEVKPISEMKAPIMKTSPCAKLIMPMMP